MARPLACNGAVLDEICVSPWSIGMPGSTPWQKGVELGIVTLREDDLRRIFEGDTTIIAEEFAYQSDMPVDVGFRRFEKMVEQPAKIERSTL